MTAAKKVGLIAAGFMLAGLFAWVGVSIYIWATPNPDREASGGMSAFGDSLVFLAMFCVAAIPTTAMGFYWLKPYRTFWLGCIPIGVVIALTAPTAFVFYLIEQTAKPGTTLAAWGAFAVLRILMAPPLALTFLLAGLFAPFRSAKISLFGCMMAETTAFALAAAVLLLGQARF